MQIHTPEKTKIVRDYLTLHKDDEPPLQNRTAAKVLHQKHPHLWPNFEAVRSSIRTVRGNNGEAKRSQCLPDLYRPNQKAGFVWKYPKSQIKPWTPFILNTPKNLIISDVHVPFHDNGALEAVWNHADAYKPDSIVLNGDFGDFFAVSRFLKNPTLIDLKGEIQAQRQMLGWIRQKFPNARIIFKLGNHDERWDKYLWSQAPLLVGLSNVLLENVLTQELKDESGEVIEPAIEGVEFVKDQRIIMLGKLPVLRGHEFASKNSNSVNAARGAFLRAVHHIMVGHNHQYSSHAQANILGKVFVSFSTGCLCDLHPEYGRFNTNWMQGFATVNVKNNHEFTVNNYRIIDGKIF